MSERLNEAVEFVEEREDDFYAVIITKVVAEMLEPFGVDPMAVAGSVLLAYHAAEHTEQRQDG